MVNELGSEPQGNGPQGNGPQGNEPQVHDSAVEAPLVRLDAEVVFQTVLVGGVRIHRAEHRGTGQHFQFGSDEHHVASLLDGQRTITQIVAQITADGLEWTAKDVAEFIGLLVAQRLAVAQIPTPSADRASLEQCVAPEIAPPGGPPPAAPALPPAAKPKRASVLTAVVKTCSLLISIRLPLMHGAAMADWMLPWARPLFTPIGMGLTGTFIAISTAVAMANHELLSGELMRLFDSPTWMLMLVFWAVFKAIHECGHAVAARSHGVRVGRVGIMFFMLAPLAYVDVTRAWTLPRRWPRVQIALAGVYFELIIASVAFWLWCVLPVGIAKHLAAQAFFLAGPATLLVNANPLLRLDGYYVLSDWADIPNLRSQGRSLLSRWLHRRVFGLRLPDVALTRWRRPFAVAHAVASFMFQIVWMGGLVVGIAFWAGPVGMAMAATAVGLWVLIPTTRWLVWLWTVSPTAPTQTMWSHRRRVIWTGVTVVLIGQFFVTLPSPFCLHLPVVARFADDQILRAPVDGFIRHVYMESGAKVRPGELILAIDNPELALELDSVRLQIRAEQVRWQQYQQSDSLGLAEASMRRLQSLRRQESEMAARFDSMRITAQREGLILTSELGSLRDRFVRGGDVVVHVGKPTHKELLISIGDRDLDAYTAAVASGEAMPVFFRGGHRMALPLHPMRPRATRTVSHPALAANAGGPLPVTPKATTSDDGEAFEWLAPRFEAVVPLSMTDAQTARAGEVGYIALQDQRSIARRIWDSVLPAN